jgi:hypothetical protein
MYACLCFVYPVAPVTALYQGCEDAFACMPAYRTTVDGCVAVSMHSYIRRPVCYDVQYVHRDVITSRMLVSVSDASAYVRKHACLSSAGTLSCMQPQ